jgi:glycosyltransferase involved in cell wall biosynthesis
VPDNIQGFSRLYRLLKGLFCNDVAVVHQSGKDIIFLVFLNQLLFLGSRRIVGIDFQFARPEPGLKGTFKAFVWKLAWSNVSLVIAHMRFKEELTRFYGIPEERFKLLPFKINGYEDIDQVDISDKGYVFTGGYSRRDYRTFCAAMALLPDIPAKLVTLNPDALKIHGVSDKDIVAPENVEVIRHDQNPVTWQRFVADSSCVVIPISSETICSNGISVCLNAMGLCKPVIISRSPAVDGIFESGNECIIVDFNDVEGMATAIRRLWDDTTFRKGLAERGYNAAITLGGVNAFMERVAQAVLAARADSSKTG